MRDKFFLLLVKRGMIDVFFVVDNRKFIIIIKEVLGKVECKVWFIGMDSNWIDW